MPQDKLSSHDIEILMNNPSAENKISIIEKISDGYNSEEFTALQRNRAEKIFRNLINDTEIEVRKTISNQLVSNKDVPVDIVLALSKDIEEVACPMLEFSDVISDKDLIEIIDETNSEESMVAIANRVHVSEMVSNALINTSNESAVTNLFGNVGANISDQGYEKAIKKFANNERVIDSLATRSVITEKIVNKMVSAISSSMCKRLESRYQSNIKELHKLFNDTTHGVTMKLLGQQTISTELLDLVNSLDIKGQIANALQTEGSLLNTLLEGLGKSGRYPIIPTLAVGNIKLFCIIMHQTTDLPYENVIKLVADKRGHEALLAKARLPKSMFECVNVAIEVIDQMHQNEEATPLEPIYSNLNLYIHRIKEFSKNKTIGQLNHFIEIIQNNIEEESGGW